MDDVKARLRAFVLSEFLPGEPAASLKDSEMLRESGIIDSLGTIKLVEFVEATFGLSVEAHEVDEVNFGSIARVASFIERRRSQR